jgi:CRISPR-associated protein Cmr2
MDANKRNWRADDMIEDSLWRYKLAAYVHDPAEKALVLFRKDHESGNVRRLKEALNISDLDSKLIKKADHIAAASDRLAHPQRSRFDLNVSFVSRPEIVHPITARTISIREDFCDIEVQSLEELSFDHFEQLIVKRADGTIDYFKTFLLFWRFGPELSQHKSLEALWQILPADTRIPDHSIWQHLNLTSALIGPMIKSDSTGIFSCSIGPVQKFIQSARSTSDFWAGSHLLSYLTFKAIEIICDQYGPDAVILPNLRGLYLTDEWIIQKMQDGDNEAYQRFKEMLVNGSGRFQKRRRQEYGSKSDSHPYYRSTIPNRFVALVPYEEAEEIGKRIQDEIRKKMRDLGDSVLKQIKKLNITQDGEYFKEQIQKQSNDFPEIYWSVVKWPLIDSVKGTFFEDKRVTEVENITNELGLESDNSVFSTNNKSLYEKELPLNQDEINYFVYKPNSGILYSDLCNIGQVMLKAVKPQTVGSQCIQRGYRCTLCGEREFLTFRKEALDLTVNMERSRNGDTVPGLWAQIAERNPSLAKPTERLCVICAIKRFWPNISSPTSIGDEEDEREVRRRVVSTHTMALVPAVESFMKKAQTDSQLIKEFVDEFSKLKAELAIEQGAFDSKQRAFSWSALPPKLIKLNVSKDDAFLQAIHELPDLVDYYREIEPEKSEGLVKKLLHVEESQNISFNYYAILKADGDQMGRLLANNQQTRIGKRLRRLDFFHSSARDYLDDLKEKEMASGNDRLKKYLESARTLSPGRHASVSDAMNNFSSIVAPFLFERMLYGKIIYCGGDDLLAFLPYDETLKALALLKPLYQGKEVPQELFPDIKDNEVKVKNGWAYIDKQLLLCLGETATISAGIVIAHYSAPLLAVISAVDRAEKRAKAFGGDAYSISIIKRSGGEERMTFKFSNEAEDIYTAQKFQEFCFLCKSITSRRSFYILRNILTSLPSPEREDELDNWKKLMSKFIAIKLEAKNEDGGVTGNDREKLNSLCKVIIEICYESWIYERDLGEPRKRSVSEIASDTFGVLEFFVR